MLSFWFSAVAFVAWTLVAVVQLADGNRRFAVLAGIAGACFGVAFVLRVRERRTSPD